jgi:hypothetical protein
MTKRTLICAAIAIIAVMLIAGAVWAKTVEITVCDICEASLADDNDYFTLEHVMSCNNDPGTKHLCSVDCLVKWAKKSLDGDITLHGEIQYETLNDGAIQDESLRWSAGDANWVAIPAIEETNE